MGFKFSDLLVAPDVNPVTKKARAVPALNPLNPYGRVFFFSWFSFMVSFWAWYAFPPLLTATIKKDLHLTPSQVANSNIVSLSSTLLVRVVAGPLCDQFGPRRVFGGLMLVGAIPVGLAPLVHDASGLYAARFFIGILGATFVPCQVWTTAFFDKNVVGTANAFTAGFGNAGGGVTYFVMPAVYDSLVAHGHAPRAAWRITFVVPLVVVLVTAVALLALCADTPTGAWDDRHRATRRNLEDHGVTEGAGPGMAGRRRDGKGKGEAMAAGPQPELEQVEDVPIRFDHEAQLSRRDMLDTAHGEVVRGPTLGEAVRVSLAPQTLFLALTYMCSFGAELAINATLAAYYAKNFPNLTQTKAADWTAMFGFLNFVTRPAGGIVSDIVYKRSQAWWDDRQGSNGHKSKSGGGALWVKKAWITVCGVLGGAALIILGALDSHQLATMVGLVALMAVFVEAGNGANFSLVPHVFPHANGVVSGVTGAGGNVGGIIFAIVFRFTGDGTKYGLACVVIGIITIAVNVLLCWIPPIPRGQIGGR